MKNAVLSKYFFTLACFYLSFSLYAQPSAYQYFYLGLYDEWGKIIDSADSRYLVNLTNSQTGQKIKYTYQNKKFRFRQEHNREAKVFITEMATGNNMILYMSGPIDSLNFKKGEYRFDHNECFLFNIHSAYARIVNRNMENFSAVNPHNFPVFYNEELDEDDQHSESKGCYNMAREMETRHGGKNWVRNVCNDTYEDYVHSLDTDIQHRITAQETRKDARVEIYPYKQQTYLRNEFYHDKSYDHIISISTDGCITWKKIFIIKDEWYVHLMYFPGSDQLGIDISNAGVILLSQSGFTEWKFYVTDQSEEPPTPKKEILILKNAGWMEDSIGKFYFSE